MRLVKIIICIMLGMLCVLIWIGNDCWFLVIVGKFIFMCGLNWIIVFLLSICLLIYFYIGDLSGLFGRVVLVVVGISVVVVRRSVSVFIFWYKGMFCFFVLLCDFGRRCL